FFFVNKRFVKDPYLHHAVMNAYEDILPADAYPLYVLFIEIDPSKIDINVHPTKTEIKYEDDKAMYAILRSAVKRSLGRYNIAPTLDFNHETSFSNFITNKPLEDIQAPTISVNPDFNPVEDTKSTSGNLRASRYAAGLEKNVGIPQNWDTLHQIAQEDPSEQLSLRHSEKKEDPSPPTEQSSSY